MYNKFKTGQVYLTPGGGSGRGGPVTRGGFKPYETRQRSFDDRPTSGAYETSKALKAGIKARKTGFRPGPIPKKLRPHTVPRTRTSPYGLRQPQMRVPKARRGLLTGLLEAIRELGTEWATWTVPNEYDGWTHVGSWPDAGCGKVPDTGYSPTINPAGPTCFYATPGSKPSYGTFKEAADADGGIYTRVVRWHQRTDVSFGSGNPSDQWDKTGEGDASPKQATMPLVWRYRSTDVAPAPAFVPDPDRKPPSPYDDDGRRTRASYRIKATEIVWPGADWTPDRFPGWGIGTTPSTGRDPWERGEPRPRPGEKPSPALQPPRKPVKVGFLPRPHPSRTVDHKQVPSGKREKKIPRLPWGMLAVLKLFHGATELDDAVSAIFDAVWDNHSPAWRKTSKLDERKPKTIWDKMAYLAENWSRVFTDPATMADTMKNLVLNEVEDRILGRLYGAGWETGVRSFKPQYGQGAEFYDAAVNDPYGTADGSGVGPAGPGSLFPWN